ncbi:MAG TPA: HD domain-containing phosphohydrolase [Solirubrobacteraceae bacterium]|nr:HD domain-containing phosphohydrolase [Solirubrobacteraceae bacterium]
MSGVTQVSFRRPAQRGASASRLDGVPSKPNPGGLDDGSGEGFSVGQEGKLDRVARQSANSAPGEKRPGDGSPRAGVITWAPWAVIALAALVGVILTDSTAVEIVCLAVLAVTATVTGWRFGESRRSALREEIDGRSNELRRALSELEIAQAETVRRLSMAVEFRDEDTGAHIERIGRLSTLLAEQIGMDAEFCQQLSHAAPLHDVGKVAIPDAILLKPGPLTPEERAIVETHAEEGHRLLRGSSSSILEMATVIALSHQEKWDGTGYPRGLVGEAIPIEGRIVAIADVFDALTSDRVYRKAFPVEDAIQMMREQRGRHFDPVLLDAFMEVLDSSGPDAREKPADPTALAESTLETYGTALERGDAETAEGSIAQAIEDGIPATTLHGEVIAPALSRIRELRSAGEIDADRERLAKGITRRVLATLYRYMIGNTEPTRERVLLAGMEGDEHALELQMMHDQIAAAGYQTVFDTDLSVERLQATVASQSPDVIVLGATDGEDAQEIAKAVEELHAAHPGIPIVLGGAAVGGSLPASRNGMRVLERIDEAVEAVEEQLAQRPQTASL